MNERIAFMAAAITAELATSVTFYLCFSASPLCAASSSLASYLGQRVPVVTLLWVLSLATVWLVAGRWLTRPRQNLSTKLRLLLLLGLTGLVIDNAVSWDQLRDSAGTPVNANLTSVTVGLAVRTLMYAVTFGGMVMLVYIVSRNQKTYETPPPRFGRD